MKFAAVHRLASLDDTYRMFDLRRQSIIKLATKGMSTEKAARWAEKLTVAGMERKICELEIWVAQVGEKVVGWGAIRGDRLEGLYTDLEFASRGIGTELLGLFEGLMKERGIPAMHAEARLERGSFYLRRGYERTGSPTSEGSQLSESGCHRSLELLAAAGPIAGSRSRNRQHPAFTRFPYTHVRAS